MNPDERAHALTDAVRSSERDQRGHIDYSSIHVRQAVVHSREDLVVVISYLASITKRLGYIRWLLVIIAIAAVVSAVLSRARESVHNATANASKSKAMFGIAYL